MCGISILVSKEPRVDYKTAEGIDSRGPDDKQTLQLYLEPYHIYAHFSRLAIIDKEGGMQPFRDSDPGRELILLCNGEIYNYHNLSIKYDLDCNSDCRVILEMYKKGISMTDILKKLDGEFAFVMIEYFKKEHEFRIYFGRDRFGIRPLYFHFTANNTLAISSGMKGLLQPSGRQVDPRILFKTDMNILESQAYYNIGGTIIGNSGPRSMFTIKEIIRDKLTLSVISRLESECPIGCLLSGGLDSSLIATIASEYIPALRTFSIGMHKDSPDLLYARKVSNAIGSIHTEIIIDPEEWLEAIPEVVRVTETYDITTIRASTGQYLLAKWISENTDIKVLLNGDGSDEISGGYLYFKNAPCSADFHDECVRLLKHIHVYDVLRVDRCISNFGLEARVPFLDHNFVDYYLSIPAKLRDSAKNPIEKYLLRAAFEKSKIPHEVLYRRKEAFSDGVSNHQKSWFEYIQDYVNTIITNDEVPSEFPSKEAYWYYKLFKEYYPEYNLKVDYWLPKWSDSTDPSARTLTQYQA